MHSIWRALKYVPPGMLATIRRLTSARLRLWIRDHSGGSHRTIPDRVITVADGRSFHIGPDLIFWPLYTGHDFEPEASSVVRRLVRPGATVLDVGANYGWYATLCGQRVGKTGQVHAFEPVPTTFERLQEHIRMNRLEDRVIPHRLAVGRERDELEIHVFDQLSHSRSSLSPLDEGPSTRFKTPVIDLDTFLHEHDIDTVDLLKCDVEGAELMALEGSRQLLESRAAPIILIEINEETSKAFGYEPQELWRFLRARGYDHFYEIDRKDSVRRVTTESELDKLTLLLCGKGGRIERLMASP